MSVSTMPQILLAGGTGGNPAGLSNPGQLEVAYENLLTQAADYSGTGSKTIVLTAGAIETAALAQIGHTETAAEVAANAAILDEFSETCEADGYTVDVLAELTDPVSYGSGPYRINALANQWGTAAAAAGLPIAVVTDVDEIGYAQSPANFSTIAAVEANAVYTLITDYAHSTYHMTASNLSVGDMECGSAANAASIGAWWSAFDQAAAAEGVQGFSSFTTDAGGTLDDTWFQDESTWANNVEALGSLAATYHMAVDVTVEGSQSNVSVYQYDQGAVQYAINIAELQASGSLNVSALTLQSWNSWPTTVGEITSPTSPVSEAAQIDAVYPLFEAGVVTATGPMTFESPAQIVLNTGTVVPFTPLSIRWDTQDAQSGNRLALVLIDQTGSLGAKQYGSGTVSNPEGNILILTGDSADLTAELGSITLDESYSGPDTIDIEAYGFLGRLSDNQISVFAAAPAQSVNVIPTTSGSQGWLSASVSLNSGTVVAASSIVTSETLDWSTSPTVTTSGTVGQPAFVDTVSVHAPLYEYGVENVPIISNGTAETAVLDYYDPSVDNNPYPSDGYANHAGANNVVSPQTSGWIGSAFDPDQVQTPLIVQSTTNTFNPISGDLETSVDALAPDPMTIVDQAGTQTDTFATQFNTGGTQVVDYNTGDNPAWLVGWGSQFSSVTITYDGAGQMVEEFFQGGATNPWFALDEVFNPVDGQLWEVFNSIAPPGYANAGSITGPLYQTQFAGSPNWDVVDWGYSATLDTEVWADWIVIGNFAGYVVNFPAQYAPAGDMNAFSYEFVNGATLDLINLPGSMSVNLNALSTVVLDSQTVASGMSGLNTIDAFGATGTVTLTGLFAGGSTLIGGDCSSTLTGYGHDTFIVGAGQTTVNTGSGGSSILDEAGAANVSVSGNGNTITAVATNLVTANGTGDQVLGNNATVYATANTANITTSGDHDVVNEVAGNTLHITGLGETVIASNITIDVAGNTSITVNGSLDILNLAGPGIALTASGADTVYITDTAADVSSDLDADQAFAASGKLAAIALTDSGTPTLTLTATRLSADATVLAMIKSTYVLSVSGATAAGAPGIAAQPNVVSVSVSDTATNIAANLPALQALATGGKLAAIFLTGTGTSPLTLSAAQLTADAAALACIKGAYTLAVSGVTAAAATGMAAQPKVASVAVSDTAANVDANLSALQTIAVGGKLAAIALTGTGTPALTLTAAQFTAGATALACIQGAYSLAVTSVTAAAAASIAAQANIATVAVNDTAAAVATNLASLETLAAGGKLAAIALTDVGTPALTLTAAQITADAAALAMIKSGYALAVTGVTAVGASSMAAQANVATVSVSDTATNIAANFPALQTLAASGKLAAIALTGTPALTVTAAQFTADGTALACIKSAYALTVTGVAAASATSMAVQPNVATVAVSDTAAHVVANLSALQALAASGKLTAITLSDGGIPTLTLTATQLAADAAALACIKSQYIVDPTASDAASIAALPNVAAVAVVDTAANVVANLNSLEGLDANGKLSSVTIEDSPNYAVSIPGAEVGANALTGILALEASSTMAGSTQIIWLNSGPTLTLATQGTAPVTVVGASDNDTINFGAGNDAVYLGSAEETVNGGSGNGTFYVTAATAGATITGGTGSNVMHADYGGAVTMGANIRGIQTVYLDNVTTGYAFGANSTAGLVIVAGTGNDVVTVGAASQTVVGGANSLRVLATASNAGAAVYAGGGGATLEITTGGTATLNNADTNLTVQADAGVTLMLPTNPSLTITGSASGDDTFVATNNVLAAGEKIDGGGVNNTLSLQGGGTFDLRAPQQLSGIQAVAVAGAASGAVQVAYLRAGEDLTLTVSDAATVIIVGAANNDVIDLGTGTDVVYLGGPGESVTGGSGSDIYCVTAATIGATISGGSGSNVMHAQFGGQMVMGAQITGIQDVYLDDGPSAFNFTANATAGMLIQAGSDSAVVTVGAASQIVCGAGGSLHVLATAANAGAAIYGGSGGASLEITTGGAAILNGADSGLTVTLDASTNLSLGSLGFITAIGASSGHDTLTAGGQNQTLQSIGGNDNLIGSSSFGDIFLGSVAGLAGDTLRNFGGNDVIDITDLSDASLKSLSFNATSGVLQAVGAAKSISLAMGGGYTSANFQAANDGHGGTMISFAH